MLDARAFESNQITSTEKAMANRITLATLRHVGRSDHVLNKFMSKKPSIRVHNVLRMALAEIYVCKTKPYAAVDLAVRLIGSDYRHFRLKGFVNAVLRKSVSSEGRQCWLDSVPTRLPSWIARPVANQFGQIALQAIESTHETEPPLDLTLKHADEAAERAKIMAAKLLSNGSLRLGHYGQISDLPGYSSGSWWVQDYAASLAVHLLGNLQGLTVLDLCSAPGGKALQCAAQGAKVTAMDRSQQRLKLLRANLRRTKLNAKTIHFDAMKWDTEQQFDVVIVDAPCSATGTIRRHPDLPYRQQENGWLNKLITIQQDLIMRALSFVKPNGRILYCVCSLLPQEGEHMIKWAIENLNLKTVNNNDKGVCSLWLTKNGCLRTRPDYWLECGGMDGFYAAVLSHN